MPTESFGMALSSLPVPTLPSTTPADSSSKKQSASTGSSSALSASSDPLLAALSQTLAQLGYTMPAGSLDTSSETNSNSNNGGDSTMNSAATTTAAQFLAALYQALALQQSISASNGGVASASDAANPVTTAADSTSSSGSVDAYLDLGSRLTDLSNASRSVDLSSNYGDADEWDIEFGDVSGPSAEDNSSEEDPLDTAISNLNDALQTHVATLDQAPGASVTLSTLLDGLSNNAGGLTWQPVGVMVDVAI